MGEEGVEPSWAETQQILSLSCMPFHHSPQASPLTTKAEKKLRRTIFFGNPRRRVAEAECFDAQLHGETPAEGQDPPTPAIPQRKLRNFYKARTGIAPVYAVLQTAA